MLLISRLCIEISIPQMGCELQRSSDSAVPGTDVSQCLLKQPPNKQVSFLVSRIGGEWSIHDHVGIGAAVAANPPGIIEKILLTHRVLGAHFQLFRAVRRRRLRQQHPVAWWKPLPKELPGPESNGHRKQSLVWRHAERGIERDK
jgi:hypothetical protein